MGSSQSNNAYAGALDRARMQKYGSCDDCGHGDMGLGTYAGSSQTLGYDASYLGAGDMDLSTIKEYSESINSAAKSNVIKELIAVGKSLGLLKGSESASEHEQIAALIKSMPSIPIKDEAHKKACKNMAMAINKVYNNTVIDANLPPEVICQQVAEILSSLNAGMHSEFLVIYEDIRRVLKNLHVLKQSLDEDRAAIMAKIEKSEDPLLAGNLSAHTDLYKMVLDEVDRQVQMLENLLNVNLMPAEKDLSKLLRSEKDFAGYIEKIDVKLGTDKFGKIISNILKGVGVTANFAALIDAALKKVGMTMEEYANSSSVQKLRERITQNALERELDPDQLHTFLDAAELLYRNFYRSKDISKVTKGAGDLSAGMFANANDNIASVYGSNDNIADLYAGGNEFVVAEGGDCCGAGDFVLAEGGNDFIVATGGNDYKKTALDKRVADRKKLRTLIFNTFYKQINTLFNQFVGTLDIMTMKVGTEIPLSDQLNALRVSLQQINENLIRNKTIYYALIGYYNDAMSKSKKEQLLSELKRVNDCLDDILAQEQYSSTKNYFLDIKRNIDGIVSLIAKYTSEILSKFGSADFIVATGANDGFVLANEAAMSGVVGGADSLYESKQPMYVPAKSIHDAIRQFDYGYRVAHIRQNMESAGRELGRYSEKYEDLVANSIADVLREDKKVYDKLVEHLDDDLGMNSTANGKKEMQAAKDFLKEQWEVKQRFWATVEAVDTYMRVFTDGMVKDPNAIKEIKAMLNPIEVINDWYNDATGNSIASVFEFFPNNVNAGNASNSPDSYRAKGNKDHYYETIGKSIAAGEFALPGNPYLVAMPSEGIKARARTKEALNGLAVLKNLLSVFVHIGSTFGGQEIHKQVFMSPTKMYNNLMDYLQCSAFAQGFGIDADIENNDFKGDSFYDASNMAVQIDPRGGVFVDVHNYAPSSTYNGRNPAIVGVTSPTVNPIQRTHDAAVERRIMNNINDNLVLDRNPANPSTAAQLRDAHGHNAMNSYQMTDVDKALLFKKRWGVWMRSVVGGLKTREGFSFQREDEYFVLILKSMAAKILTVTGMYDVLDRPMEFNGLSPIRMIIGGNGETPKVENGAIALYLRLPLLAQFYRGIFGYDDDGQGNNTNLNNQYGSYGDLRRRGDDQAKISMVPDVEGTFSELIRFVFRKNKNISTDAYSDEDIKEIIRIVNLIYQKMVAKFPQDVVSKTIDEFVSEINRRYGIITKEQRDKYEYEFGYRYDYSELNVPERYDRQTDLPETQFAILPGEGDEEVDRKSAAQRLLGEGFDSKSKSKKNPYTISNQHKDLVYKFRCAIDKYFETSSEEYTFVNAIKTTQNKLKHENDDNSRFKIVSGLVRGMDIYNKVDGMKYVLFQETVVGGLNMLSAIHTMLARFKNRAQLLDVKQIEAVVWEYLKNNSVAPNIAGVTNAIATKNREQYSEGDNQATSLIDSLLVNNVAAFAAVAGEDVDKLRNAYYGNEDNGHKRTARAFMRGILDSKYMMKELIESLFGIGNDFQGLVSVKIEDGRVTANFNGLKSLVEDMFGHISYFMDLLRPHVSTDIMDKYTNKLIPGSYYWLQEQIMEKIIVGRPAQELNPTDPTNLRKGYRSLDETSQRMSYTYNWLIQPYNTDAANITKPNNSAPVAINYNSFGNIIAEMLFYDASRAESGVLPSSMANLVDIVSVNDSTPDALRFSGVPGKKVLDTRFAARFTPLYTWKDEFTLNRSVLFSFNQLIAKYLQSFFDPISGKIYLSLINKFAGGSFNQAISNPEYTYPDTIPMVFANVKEANQRGQVTYVVKAEDFVNSDKHITIQLNNLGKGGHMLFATNAAMSSVGPGLNVTPQDIANAFAGTKQGWTDILTFGSRADPDGAHVLFTSLATIFRNIMSSKNENGISLAHVNENIADVPLYMKEKMRANLPAFRNLFKELSARCEFIKKAISPREFNLSRTFTAGNNGQHNPWPGKLIPPTIDVGAAKDRFIGIIDAVIQGCTSFITACDDTLREVGDDPKYFEIYQNSIKDYKDQYGVEPFMPITSTLSIIKSLGADNYLDMFPIYSLGNDNFKMMYGTRSLIANPTAQVLMEHVPGFANTVTRFNLMSDSKAQVDKSRADGYLKSFAKLLRFVFEARHCKGLLSSYILDSAYDIPTLRLNLADTGLYRNGLFTKDNIIIDTNPMRALDNKAVVSIVANNVADCGKDSNFTRAVYAVSHSVANIVRLTESSLRDDKIKEFVEHMCQYGKTQNSLEIQNIIDLNIVPINIHALAREIPLVNLYNYAYTFDRLIIELYYGLQNDNAKKLIVELCGNNDIGRIQSSKDMLVSLLLNPYRDLYFNRSAEAFPGDKSEVNQFDAFARGMFNGQADNGELGRPKFLSDQIYNKAIFGEMYMSKDEYNEMGPGAGLAIRNAVSKHQAAAFTAAIMGSLCAQHLAPQYINERDREELVMTVAKYMIDVGHGKSQAKLRQDIDTLFANKLANNTNKSMFLDMITTAAFISYPIIARFVNNIPTGIDTNEINQMTNDLANIVNQYNAQAQPGTNLAVLNGQFVAQKAYDILRSSDPNVGHRTDPHESRKLHWLASSTQNNAGTMRGVVNGPQVDNVNVMDAGQIKSIDVPPELADILNIVGRLRFDTVFIRNLIFITNLYRSVRIKLARDLTYSKDIITKSIPITNANITEFYGNNIDRARADYSRSAMYKKYQY